MVGEYNMFEGILEKDNRSTYIILIRDRFDNIVKSERITYVYFERPIYRFIEDLKGRYDLKKLRKLGYKIELTCTLQGVKI